MLIQQVVFQFLKAAKFVFGLGSLRPSLRPPSQMGRGYHSPQCLLNLSVLHKMHLSVASVPFQLLLCNNSLLLSTL